MLSWVVWSNLAPSLPSCLGMSLTPLSGVAMPCVPVSHLASHPSCLLDLLLQ
jgi:hypothetical protein